MKFSKYKIFVIILLTLLQVRQIFPQSGNTTYVSKRAGICFRVDDNNDIYKFRDYSDVFAKYNLKYSFALNLGMTEFDSPAYRDSIRVFQNMGHEWMDHTPNHRPNFFFTKFDTLAYDTLLGVDHRKGTKVCLTYEQPDTTKAKRSGFCDINHNKVTINQTEYDQFTSDDIYLYFPSLDTLVFLPHVNDGPVLDITDFWEDSLDLGVHSNIKYYNFEKSRVHMTVSALKTLADETLKLADLYGYDRPYTWIQPGGNHPFQHKNEIKAAMGDQLNYTAGAVYPDDAEQVFNEYDPNGEQRFAMQWGDFLEDETDLQTCKSRIADGIAKHQMIIGHSHFVSYDGWNNYLERTDSLLAWAVRNNIPVKTYTEWADILYTQIPDPYENIFPALNVDLDENNEPDGFETKEGRWKNNDGINGYCYEISKVGEICRINFLGGVEKGENNFEIWTKGEEGDSVEVTFSWQNVQKIYKFPAESDDWQKYTLFQSNNPTEALDIPANISTINIKISCSDHQKGKLKISGMWLGKKIKADIKVFLEGAYANNDTMSTNLISLPDFPKKQPYDSAPWNYNGNENLSSIPQNMVDWILVELRDKQNPDSIVARRAGILLKNGKIVDLDGVSPLNFKMPEDDYFIAIKHRNHLGIRSSQAVSLSYNTATYDFSAPGSTYGNGSEKDLGDGNYGMYAGDTDSNGVIDAADRNPTWNKRNSSGYLSEDVIMNGVIDAADRNNCWNNRNKNSAIK